MKELPDNGLMPITHAAQWLATLAAADGVVSPNERKVLRDFATAFNIDVSSIYRMAHAIANKVPVPEVEFLNPSEMKGRKFEEFVVSLLADKSRDELLAWRSDKIVNGTYAAENLMPDLLLRHKLNDASVEYYIECKYRSFLPDGVLDLSGQLGRYRRMTTQNGHSEMFIALGLGGTPSNPDELYIIPSRMIRHEAIIRIANFQKCICSPIPEAYQAYIELYFNKRVFKKSEEL